MSASASRDIKAEKDKRALYLSKQFTTATTCLQYQVLKKAKFSPSLSKWKACGRRRKHVKRSYIKMNRFYCANFHFSLKAFLCAVTTKFMKVLVETPFFLCQWQRRKCLLSGDPTSVEHYLITVLKILLSSQ